MSLWTLVDGWAGEFIAHWTFQIGLDLLVVMSVEVKVVETPTSLLSSSGKQ